MNYTTPLLFIALFWVACNNAPAVPVATAHLKTDTFKVWGNCSMCKKTIEKSLKVEGLATADWNKDSKIITVVYDSTALNLTKIQQNIAAAGYDNDGQRGDDAAYANLHSCCHYERK